MTTRDVVIDCPRCDGSGFIPDPDSEGFMDTECPACMGEGYLEGEVEDYE